MMDWKGGSRKMVQDNPLIDQVMMLRFRPIAPKPPEGDPESGRSRFRNKGLMFSGIRTKRKYVRVRRTQRANYTVNKEDRDRERKRKVPEEKKIVTLQLLPEKPEEASTEDDKGGDENNIDNIQWLFSFPCPNPKFPHVNNITGDHHDDPRVNGTRSAWVHQTGSITSPVDQTDTGSDCVESRVIVETINTGSGIDGLGLGKMDIEKVTRLGFGECPGFVSDPSGRVVWVNGAYEAMVLRQLTAMKLGLKRRPEMVVRLVVKEGLLLPYWSGSFTSRVKIEHTWRQERWSQTVPCDVWRSMDSGGFAWRLDLDAALSLAI